MNKPICLITGATEGVGRATAIELAKKDFTVVLAARNAAKAEMVMREIKVSAGNADADYILADLTSLKQVSNLAGIFRKRYPELDVLINNAGIFAGQRQLTEDGFETSFQVNYLSQFLLTQMLLPELKKSAQGRIVNLSSSVYSIGKFDPGNLQSEKRFSAMAAYSASKLHMLMFTLELAKRLRETRVTANAVHPGIVRTQMMMRAPGLFRLTAYLALTVAISPRKGAATPVYLACSREVKNVSGEYFIDCKPQNIKTKFNTDGNRELLWNMSMKNLHEAGDLLGSVSG
jgi:NAD(P)-dependent dehydrogenase (short-subunit alcohol dehydrogenase family)